MFKREKTIENVYGHTWDLAWNEHRVATLTILVALGITLIFLPFTLLIAALYFGYFYFKAKKDFYKQFAKRYKMQYIDQASLDTVSGKLFSLGDSSSITHVLEGKLHDLPARFFNFSTYTGTDKNRKKHNFTVLEISFAKTRFPYILLQSKSMPKFHYNFLGNEIEVPLEEVFAETYKLYSTEGFEIEVFEILTPETLASLQKNMPHVSLEFSGNKIYFYDDKSIVSRKDLEVILESVKHFVDKTGARIERMHDDFAALAEYYK